jgi:hypothetical protein
MTDVLQGRCQLILARGRIVLSWSNSRECSGLLLHALQYLRSGRVGQSAISVAGVEAHADLPARFECSFRRSPPD